MATACIVVQKERIHLVIFFKMTKVRVTYEFSIPRTLMFLGVFLLFNSAMYH